MTPTAPAPEGVLVVDKPAGLTSHDVVARVRRAAGTRRVGHAGTLDPMATGVLVIGIGRATRLLGFIAGSDKDYVATIRLGESRHSDDADGDRTAAVGVAVGSLDVDGLRASMVQFSGTIEQRPSSVSAIKVQGRRAHALVRAGETVDLPSRTVTVERFELLAARPALTEDGIPVYDLDVEVRCSTGTYVRALARDLGEALGVGGHLTALRRTRVGGFTVAEAVMVPAPGDPLQVMPLAAVAARALTVAQLDAAGAVELGHGRTVDPLGGSATAPVAAIGPDGALVALVGDRGGRGWPLVVFA